MPPSVYVARASSGYQLSPLQQMLRKMVTPDVLTCSACISTCEKGQSMGRDMSPPQQVQLQMLIADAITYNASISACKEGHQWKMALSLLQPVQEKMVTPDVITHNAPSVHARGASTVPRHCTSSNRCSGRDHP